MIDNVPFVVIVPGLMLAVGYILSKYL